MPLLGENETAIKRLSVFSKQAFLMTNRSSKLHSTLIKRYRLLNIVSEWRRPDSWAKANRD
jgi:hypothetical protein